MAERTGYPGALSLWSYVMDNRGNVLYDIEVEGLLSYCIELRG